MVDTVSMMTTIVRETKALKSLLILLDIEVSP
jgi:hypothetical protein